MKRTTWLDEKKDEILKMYDTGKKQIEIAKCFNTTQSAISTRLRKWGKSNPDGNRFKRVRIPKDILYDLYWNKKWHPSRIGKKFGCSIMSVHHKMTEYGIPTRTKSEARMGNLNPIYDIGHTEEARNKMSESFANGRKIGFHSHWGRGDYYNTPNQGKKWMRSGWEIKVADYLTTSGYDWYYEYEWLNLSYGINYLPDFYLPKENKYIEIKGRKDKNSIKKITLAQKQYNVELWDGEELLKRGIIDNCGIAEINRKYKKLN